MTTPYDPSSPSGVDYHPESAAHLDHESNVQLTDEHTPASSETSSGDAKHQAAQLKDSAADEASHVAQTGKEQAQQVTEDVRQQARKLAGETKTQLTDQANSQRDHAVTTLRSLGDELNSMSESGSKSGLGSQLAREGSQLTHKAAEFLDDRDPGQIIDEVRAFARRRPGTFLLGAAVAGVVVGRLTRGAVSANKNGEGAATSSQPDHVTHTETPYGAHAEAHFSTPRDDEAFVGANSVGSHL